MAEHTFPRSVTQATPENSDEYLVVADPRLGNYTADTVFWVQVSVLIMHEKDYFPMGCCVFVKPENLDELLTLLDSYPLAPGE